VMGARMLAFATVGLCQFHPPTSKQAGTLGRSRGYLIGD
jgi:hypothetical protein